jgi:hypothetical protein
VIFQAATTEGAFVLEAKRCYLPIVITGACPSCSAPWEFDMRERYLSHPTIGEVDGIGCHCGACEHEWQIPAVIRVTIELVPPSGEGGEG